MTTMDEYNEVDDQQAQWNSTGDELTWMIEFRERVIQKSRIQMGNRLSALDRGADETTEVGYALIERWAHTFLDLEETLDEDIREYVRLHEARYPIIAHLKELKGVGDIMATRIAAPIDIRKARYAGSLIKYAGYSVVFKGITLDYHDRHAQRDESILTHQYDVDTAHFTPYRWSANGKVTLIEDDYEDPAARGYLEGRVIKATPEFVERLAIIGDWELEEDRWPIEVGDELVIRDLGVQIAERPVKGEKLRYNATLKKACYWLGSQFIMARGGSPYKDLYYEQVERYQRDRPAWTEAHCKRAARRKMIKVFLSHLYMVWRTIEGLPVYPLYVHDKLDHQTLMTPEEFGWNVHVTFAQDRPRSRFQS